MSPPLGGVGHVSMSPPLGGVGHVHVFPPLGRGRVVTTGGA